MTGINTGMGTNTGGVPAGFSSPTQKVLALKTQIKALTTSLSSGKPVLSAQQQTDVVSLSKQTTTESAALTSIAAAKLALSGAQKQLDAITNKMYSLQRMAAMAASGASDSSFLNTDFLGQFGDLGKLAIAASSDAGNLLAGTAGIFVQVGTDDSPASRLLLRSINVTGMLTFGSLANISIDSARNANAAMAAFSSAMTTLAQGKISLATMAKDLAQKESALNQLQTADNARLQSLTTVNKSQVKAQISKLQQQLAVYQSISSLA